MPTSACSLIRPEYTPRNLTALPPKFHAAVDDLYPPILLAKTGEPDIPGRVVASTKKTGFSS